MEEYVVYVLYSEVCNRKYVGYTSDLINRMKSHNIFGKGYTVRCRPWNVIYVEFYQSKRKAIEREKYFKSGVGREWLNENTKS